MTGSSPEISVVVATHNRAERLHQLLESLRAQMLPRERFEVVVVDDGSRDGTRDVLATQARRDGLRLDVVHRARAAGPAVARNEGIARTCGRIVAFTDDDCLASPGWLEAVLAACAAHPGAIVQGRVAPRPDEAHLESPFARTLRVETLGPYFQTANISYPRELLERHGGFDQSFTKPGGEDTDLAWRMRTVGVPAVFAEDALVLHAVSRIGVVGRLRVALRWSRSMHVYQRYPELRRTVFFRGIFWKWWHYALLRAALALVLPRRLRPLTIWLVGPYANFLIERGRYECGGARHAPFYLVEDLVEIGAMVSASIRSRMLVL